MQSLNHSRICEETKTRGRRGVSIPTRKDLEKINAEWGEDGEMGTRLARERVGTYPLLGALLRARACTRHRVHFRIAPLRSTEKHSAPAPSVCARGGSHSKPLRATDLTRDWAAARVRVRPALPSFVGLQFVERAEALAAQPDAIDRIGAVPNAFNEVSIERTSRIHVTRLQSGSGNAARFRFLIHTIAKFGAHKGRI
jgi:hypothetical protein